MQQLFPRIDAADYRQQLMREGNKLHELFPFPASTAPVPQKRWQATRKRSATEAVAAAAAADALPLRVPEHKRGKYARWFDSPYITTSSQRMCDTTAAPDVL
jgi:hypothetical protein